MSNEQRKVQLSVGVDAGGVRQGMQQAADAVKDGARQVEGAAAGASKGVDGIGAAAGASSKKVEAATRSIVGSIQRTIAVAEAGAKGSSSYFEALAKQRGIDPAALKPYLDQLDAAKAKQAAAAAEAEKANVRIGMSAKATAAAMRTVPAQFTDIITSIASGQAPLTVLLQQGGQLKDMFGGVGAAAKAIGTYIVGLVNPFTIAAAAVGVLGYAFSRGSAEQQAFRAALIETGSASGATVDRLLDMSVAMAQLGTTRGKASEALAIFVQTGGVGADGLQRFASAAIQLERAGGPSIEKTAKAFQALADEPLKASLKLNEGLNYLTRAAYEQIKSLDEQGKTVKAARVAQEEYAKAIEQRTPDMLANLGLVERAWMGIKNSSAGAWDFLLNIGRGKSGSESITSFSAEIARLEERIRKLKETGAGAMNVGELPALEKQLEQTRLNQALAQEKLRLEGRAAALLQAQAQAVAAKVDWDKQGLQVMDEAAKKQRQMNLEIEQARDVGQRAGLSQVEIEKRIAAIRAFYADKNPFIAGQEAAKTYAEAMKQLVDIQEKAKGKTEGLSAAQQVLARMVDDGTLQAMPDAWRIAVVQMAAAVDETERAAASQDRYNKILAKMVEQRERQQDSYNRETLQIDERVKQLDRETAALGLGRQAVEELRKAEIAREVTRLEALANTEMVLTGDEDERQAILDRIAALNRLGAAEAKNTAQARTWATGWEAAFSDYAAAAKDQASAAGAVFRDITAGMEDALVTFATTGKLSFKRMADSIIQDLLRIQIRAMIVKALSGFGGGGGGSISTGGAEMDAMLGLTPRAAGGPVIADRPYLVGERGRELFVPASNGTIVPTQALGAAAAPFVFSPQIRIDGALDTDRTISLINAAMERSARAFQDNWRRNGGLARV